MLSKNQFNKGIILTAFGSFWWGFIGVVYFKYIAFAGHIEVVLHRSAWTTVMLILTTIILSKWKKFSSVFKDKKKVMMLFLSGLLIFTNWAVWIYAIGNDCLLYTSPSPRDLSTSRMPSSA